jgi:hypothetical protein
MADAKLAEKREGHQFLLLRRHFRFGRLINNPAYGPEIERFCVSGICSDPGAGPHMLPAA